MVLEAVSLKSTKKQVLFCVKEGNIIISNEVLNYF